MTLSNPIPVAVIGAGRMGGHHARVYSKTPGCKLVAVVDKDLERAKAIAELHGCRAIARVSEIIDDIAAATVAVPTVYHAEVTIPLLERRIPVLVEKPLAPDTTSAKLILDASRRHRTLVQVGHSERFNPVVQAMLKMGVAPRYIEAQRISPFTFRSADVGVVLDMMIHDIDIVLHLVRTREETSKRPNVETSKQDGGPVGPRRTDGKTQEANEVVGAAVDCTVDAVGVRVLGASEDVANARVRFADGTVASLTASRLALKTDRRIRIFCPTAYISMDYQRKSGIAIKLHDNVDLIRLAKEKNFEDLSQMASMDFSAMLKVEPIVVDDVEPLQAEINAFLEAIRTGGQSAVTAEEGYAAVEMAERISRSIREQEWGAELQPG